MQFYKAFKVILPVAFFGYAAVANLTLARVEFARPDIAGLFSGTVTGNIDGIYRDNLPHREAAIGWIGAARYVLLNEGRSGVVSGRDGWLFSEEEFRSANASDTSVQEALKWIASVGDELALLGAKLVVVPLPAKVDINRDQAKAQMQSEEMAAFYQEVLANLNASQIAFVDTRPALQALDLAFFQTDTHWTSAGAESVARQIALSENVPAGDLKFEKHDREKVTFIGDLVSFVTSDEIAPLVGLEAESVGTFVALAPSPENVSLNLFASEGPVPYALGGTSYSANENWGFLDALKLSLGHDVLNFAEQGQGPIAPMRAYLKQVGSAEVPEIVIWEIPVRYLTDPKVLEQTVEQST